ncbi:ABC transporter ATP-binding protein [Anaerotignum sp. MB30-C6]|uniref:ABC transporter ATP-binding protein n=1 Tax=Anaerotignum sp. MB30-C6 TaxID=3070814 RepID=UPI0027DE7A71|nr:ABC transporter ATP-binding protein [Anaerotignum sp. MB30-C6]WMI80778.1 ABC transporter ATP-binding protein [Anaerotignum sp. MB30-C6]
MLNVKNIEKTYKCSGLFTNKRQPILQDVSFSMDEFECLGIIGESGSGKSTLGRLILGIEKPDSGEILFEGQSVQKAKHRRGNISAVFQDYTSSINPNETIRTAIKEPMVELGLPCDDSIIESLLIQVGLDGTFMDKYPHELSGGQAQRVCIARTISTNPKFLILDEAISSLDVSVQLRILKLLKDLREKYKMSYLFITHDIQAAAYICDRLIIFNEGRIVEQLPIKQIGQAKKEYSKQLLNAIITV